MTANELFKIEHSNKDEIHLVKAGKFWQAWEKSAFFFVKNFEPYEVKARFIKIIGTEMVYLGFPEEALGKILAKTENLKCSVTEVDEKHFVIRNFLLHSGYESWKTEVYQAGIEKRNLAKLSYEVENNRIASKNVSLNVCEPLKISKENLLLAYKETYESVKYIFTRSGEMSKLYRYGLGDKLRGECLDFLDVVNGANMGSKRFEGCIAFDLFCRIRIKLRMLLDFREMSEKQWFYINERLENIKNLLRLESFGLRFKGVG